MGGEATEDAGAPTVVVAMDKFKGSATAAQACRSVCAGIGETRPDWSCVAIPLADGGDGTVDALLGAGWQAVTVRSIDAQDRPTTAVVARRDDTVVVELAGVCGIARWDGEPAPWDAHTIGLGLVMREMVDAGVDHIVIGLGGSASTDGGSGVLTGLGFALLDADGAPVAPGLAGLRSVERIEPPADIDTLRTLTWTVLVDVDSPLTGPRGAARRFGPQKGLSPADVDVADELLGGWELVLARASGRIVGAMPGTGAAGGVGAALVALLDAHITSGFDFIAEQVDLRPALAAADAVVTGEGRLDASSLTGKVPGAVLDLVAGTGIPVFVVVGDVDQDVRDAHALDDAEVITLVELAGDLASALHDPTRHLRSAGQQVGLLLGRMDG